MSLLCVCCAGALWAACAFAVQLVSVRRGWMAKFDTLAGQLQAAQVRTGDLLELIAAKFGAAMPESVKVVREWRILGGRIKEINLHLGVVRYRIEAPRAPGYSVHRQQVVHGVAVGAAEPIAP